MKGKTREEMLDAQYNRNLKTRKQQISCKMDYCYFMSNLPIDCVQLINEFCSMKKVIDEYHEAKFKAYMMFYFSDISDQFVRYSVPKLHEEMHNVALRARIRYEIISRNNK